MRGILKLSFVAVACLVGFACTHGGMDHGRDGDICGGIQGLPCDDGEFCQLEPGNCSSADLQGVCVTIPEICTQQFDPVCGCDGKTYGNDCERRAAAAQLAYEGECEATG